MIESQPYELHSYMRVKNSIEKWTAFNMRQGVVPLYNLTKQKLFVWIVVSVSVSGLLVENKRELKTLPFAIFRPRMFIKYICYIAAQQCLHWKNRRQLCNITDGCRVEKETKKKKKTLKYSSSNSSSSSSSRCVRHMCVQNKITHSVLNPLYNYLTAMHHQWAYAFNILSLGFSSASQHMLFCCWL